MELVLFMKPKKDNRVLQQVRGGVLSIMVMLATLNSGETSKRRRNPQMGSRRIRLKKILVCGFADHRLKINHKGAL